MSLQRNILANYASQFYVTLLGIVTVPVYVRYMGAEAYGLIGFFAMVQVWFGLLDMGLTLTLVRETARFRGKAVDVLVYRSLVRALELIFLVLGILGAVVLFFNAASIAVSWLNVQQIEEATVVASLQLMALAIAMRWMSGLYRGIVSGSEEFVWLGGFNAAIASLRFLGVLPFLILLDGDPIVFFEYQCLVGFVELAWLFAKASRLMPAPPTDVSSARSWTSMVSSVRQSFSFSLSISFAALVWVLFTQSDKLLLSKLLPLADYGVFTLAVLAAGGVSMIAGPLSSALLPRLTLLNAQGDEVQLTLLYGRMTRAVVVMVAPASFLLAIFSERVLFAWTGNQFVVEQGAVVLGMYALGNAILAASSFPYYLQYAKGDLRLHLMGSALFLLLFIPLLLLLTRTYGVNGAGYAWFVANFFYLLLWTPVVHRRFASGYHSRWLIHDVLAPSLVGICILLAFSMLMSVADAWPNERISTGLILVFVGSLAFFFSIWSQSDLRSLIRKWIEVRT